VGIFDTAWEQLVQICTGTDGVVDLPWIERDLQSVDEIYKETYGQHFDWTLTSKKRNHSVAKTYAANVAALLRRRAVGVHANAYRATHDVLASRGPAHYPLPTVSFLLHVAAALEKIDLALFEVSKKLSYDRGGALESERRLGRGCLSERSRSDSIQAAAALQSKCGDEIKPPKKSARLWSPSCRASEWPRLRCTSGRASEPSRMIHASRLVRMCRTHL
jgi:hypothetical protein